MLNKFEQSIESGKMISDLAGGCEVKVIYNASFGILDAVEAAAGLLFRFETRPVRLKREVWSDFLFERPKG